MSLLSFLHKKANWWSAVLSSKQGYLSWYIFNNINSGILFPSPGSFLPTYWELLKFKLDKIPAFLYLKVIWYIFTATIFLSCSALTRKGLKPFPCIIFWWQRLLPNILWVLFRKTKSTSKLDHQPIKKPNIDKKIKCLFPVSWPELHAYILLVLAIEIKQVNYLGYFAFRSQNKL